METGQCGEDQRALNHGFLRVWTALTVALFGAQVSALALPLAATLTLGASAWQMGLLAAAGQAPFLLCSLPFGVWVDRAARRRPLLIAADLGRAGLLALVPLASLVGLLRIELLYGVAFLVGVLNALFDVAHYSYVPALVGRERVVGANGKIQVSYSAADAAGPGIAGILIRVVSAPLAVAATALTFLGSALVLGTIGQPERAERRETERAGFRAEIGEGMRGLLCHPYLRPVAVVSAWCGLFVEGVRALVLLFAARELGLGASTIGAVLACGGAAAVAGGLVAGRVAEWVGFGRTVLGGWLLEGGALLLLPFADGRWALAWLIAAQIVGGLAGAAANVNQWSLRQIATPDHLQARVTASHRCLVYGAFPLGSLLGGALASQLGLRPAIALLAVGATLAPLWLLRSPVVALRDAAALAPGAASPARRATAPRRRRVRRPSAETQGLIP